MSSFTEKNNKIKQKKTLNFRMISFDEKNFVVPDSYEKGKQADVKLMFPFVFLKEA